VPLIGLNCQESGFGYKNLLVRDRFAAQKICDSMKSFEVGRKFIVIFGDLHLAQVHLPKETFKKIGLQWQRKALIVLQNVEEIFFEMLEKSLELTVDVIKLPGNRYILQNVPPWVKWQHYLIFLEQKYDTEIDNEIDYSDWMDQIVKILSQELGLSCDLISFELDTIDHPQLFKKIGKNLSSLLKKTVLFNIENEVSFFLPEQRRAILARPSINHAASVAMSILLSSLAKVERFPLGEESSIYSLIWWEACSYFGSKVMNPKRKSLTARDIKIQMEASAHSAFRKAVLQTAIDIKLRDYLFIEKGDLPKFNSRRWSVPVTLEVSKILGSMLGEKLYLAYKLNYLSKKNLKKLFSQPLSGSGFQNFYFELISLLNGLPEPFESKEEKL
jgi:hypothetical protein